MNAYSKMELAMMYMPTQVPITARFQLMRWIACNDELQKALFDAGYHKHNKMFTPKQVEIIFSYLGEPRGLT